MESLYLLIPISIILLMIGVAVYFWAVKSGQYDDLEREGESILFDDEPRQASQLAASKPTTDEPRDTDCSN